METLIIGLDGGDERMIRSLDLDNLISILDDLNTFNIREDLWNRGWASIVCGEHCHTTGAVYEKPKFDGMYGFTQGFGTQDYNANESLTPLWELLNERGYSIGFLGVPTTMPAPSVDGFFVSGAGSGYSPEDGVPKVGCHPTEVWDIIQEREFYWESRFNATGIIDSDTYIKRLKRTVRARTNLFVDLQKKYDVDVGFITHKEFAILSYLAMADINEIIEYNETQSEFQELISEFYKELDSTITQIINELNPKNVIVCGDHSQSAYKYSMNVNALLHNEGFLREKPSTQNIFGSVLSSIARFTPDKIKSAVKNNSSTISEVSSSSNYLLSDSKAFAHRYIPGIYVNDSRFGSPVVNSTEVSDLVDQLVDLINNKADDYEIDFFARPYRCEHQNVSKSNILPDIWIDTPDTVFFEDDGKFIQENEWYGPAEPLRQIERDMHAGTKGSEPILFAPIDNLSEQQKTGDLRTVYNIVDQLHPEQRT